MTAPSGYTLKNNCRYNIEKRRPIPFHKLNGKDNVSTTTFHNKNNICFCDALHVSTLKGFRIKEPGLLGCCTVWMGNFPDVSKELTAFIFSAMSTWIDSARNRKAAGFFKTLEINYPVRRCNNTQDHALQQSPGKKSPNHDLGFIIETILCFVFIVSFSCAIEFLQTKR